MDEMRESEFTCRGFLENAPKPPPAPTPGPGWERPRREQPFDLPWPDEVLAEGYRRSRGGCCLRCPDGGFRLAYPLDCRRPFPLPALFCFARAALLGGRGWWVFAFDPDGRPCFGGV